MPLYEYECDNGHRFELIVKFSDPPLETCPTCGAPVHKLMSSPAIQFKGSGWYITDYARKGEHTKDTKESKDTKETKETKESKDTKESAPKSESSSAAETSTKTSTESKSTAPATAKKD